MSSVCQSSGSLVGLVDGNDFYVSCERVVNPGLKGRPVAVLLNNDGCCVAMSPEFKALGIPCGIGFARTKTLAKIANHIGKKTKDGVFVLPDDPTEILAGLPVGEVWGVGRRLPQKLFAEGARYRKSGVVFFGLEKAGSAYQADLFAPVEKRESSALYRTIDALNRKLGRGTVFSAAEGIGPKPWAMKRSKLSKRATTNWDELLTVGCVPAKGKRTF